MIQAVAVLGAAMAMAGAGLVMVSDGARGLALGQAAIALGLGLSLAGDGRPASGLVLAAGGIASAGLRLRGGGAAWQVLPEGTSSRIVLWLVASGAALYLAGSVLTGPAAEVRTGGLAVVVLSGARLLGTSAPLPALASLAILALGLGALGSTQGDAILTAAAAAALAVIAAVVPGREAAGGS